MAINYREAGVDIEAGDRLVDWLRSSEKKSPHADKIVAGIGGFAALFRADFKSMKSPLLVSGTDGVGTKVKVASHFNDYSGVGQDLVAMCVNDLICTGGEPLFFLDYYATGKLDLKAAKQFLESVRRACHESGCALIGGETAEMPGVYQAGDFDCAGFSVGVVDEPEVLGPHRVRVGDALIGLKSSGFHSNGYSLLRKVFADDLDRWRDELLKPTRLYVAAMKELRSLKDALHAGCHVTGGGLDNLLRVLPEGCALRLKPWSVPEPFREVRRRTGDSWESLVKTLNCGVGFVFYVDPKHKEAAVTKVKAAGYEPMDLGEVVAADEKAWSLDFSAFEVNGG